MIASDLINQRHTDFIDQLRRRNRIKLIGFDRCEWFRGAYSTIQRTLRGEYSPLSKSEKDSCKEWLFLQVPRLGGTDFDGKLRQLIEETSGRFKISFGHAQKLIAILIKYAVACHVRDEGVPREWTELVRANQKLLPVPIDAVVLYHLSIHPSGLFGDIRAGAGTVGGRKTYWARVKCASGHAPWSKLNDYNAYWHLQTRVRSLAAEVGLLPLEFEMTHLWPTETQN